MEDFAAIDFETANEQRSSICSVGVVIVRCGQVLDTFYSLIRPEPEYYSHWNTKVHGLTFEDTLRSPIFPTVWSEIIPRIEGLPLVAHNKGFDESCLKAVFRTYNLDYPDYHFYCTLQSARRKLKGLPNYQLHTVAASCGYHLENHHHALADAEACAWIAKSII
ncbi:3'-5' exonuclease [Bacteroidaceae bacterium HV4-6-C5C]|jgi:DNA polymerase-3 subunit epsilon|nr:3'-5' exonuclease [Bacteroidaceae bacterium HV4-6-C5C]